LAGCQDQYGGEIRVERGDERIGSQVVVGVAIMIRSRDRAASNGVFATI